MEHPEKEPIEINRRNLPTVAWGCIVLVLAMIGVVYFFR